MHIVEKGSFRYLTSSHGEGALLSTANLAEIIAACLEEGVTSLLMHEKNVSPPFFQLQTLEAGEILQKLRTYGIRCAVVVSPSRPQPERFREMASEEKKGRWFSVFSSRQEAESWLLNG